MAESTASQSRSADRAAPAGRLSRLARDLPGKVRRLLLRYYRRYFQNRNHVFVHRGPFPPEHRDDCTFVRYDRFEDVPPAVREAIVSHGGDRALETDRREMADGSMLWVAFVGGQAAGARHVRPADRFRRWFVPLGEDDIVIFRGRTFPPYRGRGISPSMMRHIMHTELAAGGVAFTDCRVYNKPSIRSIEKAGFERIATMKPIARQEAVRTEIA